MAMNIDNDVGDVLLKIPTNWCVLLLLSATAVDYWGRISTECAAVAFMRSECRIRSIHRIPELIMVAVQQF